MYLKFFGLNEKPFSITPDPRYLYMSERHADALAHLLYGISESGGFVQLTGEVGTGKTTLVRSLLEQIPEHADVALIFNPQVSAIEFLQGICDELGVSRDDGESTRALVNALNRHLLTAHARGRRTVLIVDEAQNLDPNVLEQVRMLTNLETARQKLLQIILIGQPELRTVLARNDMRQLAQRITGRYHLEPLSREDTEAYLNHRLRVAGATGRLFPTPAARELYRLSGGVPRLINIIADRALLGAYSRERPVVDRALVRRAASEVFGSRLAPFSQPRLIAGLAIIGVALLAFGGWQAWQQSQPAAPAVAADNGTREVASLSPRLPAPVAPPGVDIVSLGELLGTGLDTSTDGAFGTLFELWREPYAPGDGLACTQAEALGLACLFQRGSLSHLLKLNRPAILNLTDEYGEPHQVVIDGVADDAARLAIGGERFWVGVPELSEYWFGDYLLLWRPETREARALTPGMRDNGVLWLRRSLAELTGDPVAPEDSPLFDDDVESRVREFQRRQRLVVDGLVGPRTMIIMQRELGDSDMPRLVEES